MFIILCFANSKENLLLICRWWNWGWWGLKPKTCKIKKECQICDFGWGWAFSTAISKNWPVNLNSLNTPTTKLHENKIFWKFWKPHQQHANIHCGETFFMRFTRTVLFAVCNVSVKRKSEQNAFSNSHACVEFWKDAKRTKNFFVEFERFWSRETWNFQIIFC